MQIKQVLQRIPKVTLVLVFIFIYLIFYAIVGQRGIIAYYKNKETIVRLVHTNSLYTVTWEHMEKEMALLKDSAINKDYLEVLASKKLGLISPRLVIISHKTNKR